MLPMESGELFQRVSVALAIGLLIGLERGWRARADEEGERAAGLRTHALAALLGAVWGGVAQPLGEAGAIMLGLAFAAFSVVVGVFRYREAVHDETFGATTVVAIMLTFALGAYAMIGDLQIAGASGVAATALLGSKTYLHDFVRRVTWPELRSGLVILVMTFILLPVLPDRPIDRWGAINPAEIWLMTIMIAAISFAGYIAVKLIGGQRGLAVAGLAGGLASSTAVTVAMARLCHERPGRARLTAAATLLADAVMAPRILAVVAVADVGEALRLAPALGAAALAFLAGGFIMQWRAEAEAEAARGLNLRNPLDLGAVLKFGALLSVVMTLARLATGVAGNVGAYALSALSGVADVDAIALSMARLARSELGYDAATRAILLALATNTAGKAAMGWFMGGAGLGWRLSAVSALALAAAGTAHVVTPPFG